MKTRKTPLEFKSKLKAALFDGWDEDLQIVGDIAADEIVRTTLAGLGEDDLPFAAYSKSYEALMDAVGGKPGGVVDLRGVFFEKGKGIRGLSKKDAAYVRENSEIGRLKRKLLALKQRRSRDLGGGRRAFVRVEIGGRSFTAQTLETRPRRGVVDTNSEMSRDLIATIVGNMRIRIRYTPRRKSYMIHHQRGTARGGKTRKWFTIRKTAVRGAVMNSLQSLFRARVAAFSKHQAS